VVVRKGEPPHYHAEHDLWVTVLKGKGEFWLEGTRFEVRSGSNIFIPRGGRHYVTNQGRTPLAAFVVATPPYDGTDTVLLDT
jgi:quercetin dioxygenase-like cupin family protein